MIRIQAAALLTEMRRLDCKQARSYYVPHVSAEAAFERGNNPGFFVSRMMRQGWFDRRFLSDPLLLQDPDSISNAQMRVPVNQVIYDGGSIRAGMNMAQAGKQAVEAQQRSSGDNLARLLDADENHAADSADFHGLKGIKKPVKSLKSVAFLLSLSLQSCIRIVFLQHRVPFRCNISIRTLNWILDSRMEFQPRAGSKKDLLPRPCTSKPYPL
jgi:hypothetical protein